MLGNGHINRSRSVCHISIVKSYPLGSGRKEVGTPAMAMAVSVLPKLRSFSGFTLSNCKRKIGIDFIKRFTDLGEVVHHGRWYTNSRITVGLIAVEHVGNLIKFIGIAFNNSSIPAAQTPLRQTEIPKLCAWACPAFIISVRLPAGVAPDPLSAPPLPIKASRCITITYSSGYSVPGITPITLWYGMGACGSGFEY